MEQQQISLQNLIDQNLTASVQTLEKFLDGALSVDPNAPVSAIEEEVLARTAKKKLKNDSVITVKNRHGRPFLLQKITQPEKASSEASQRTNRARSKSQKQFLYNATTTKKQTEQKLSSVVIQTTSLVWRKLFTVCSKCWHKVDADIFS